MFENEVQFNSFKSSLRAGQYNLLLGAGVSLDSQNSIGFIPSGSKLRAELCKLKGVSETKTLQKVFELLDEAEIDEIITKRFSGCRSGKTLKKMSKFIWKRIFTWNIDDATEDAYREKSAKQNLIPVHFSDPYNDERDLSELLLVKLHGTVVAPEKGYVFSRDEYIQLIKSNSPWMTVLTQYMASQPFIIMGASMDEVDLDFYLLYRTSSSGRDDQGPSIMVEPYPDAVTLNECKKHNLILFRGTAEQFLDYCDDSIPNRPTPIQLIPSETIKLLPENISNADVLRFNSDFELVPSTGHPPKQVSPFLYGHSPTWGDLSAGFDISRNVVGNVISHVESRIENTSQETRLFVISDVAGSGKTTSLRRIAFELSVRGYKCLICSALSRIEQEKTTYILNNIQGPLVVFIDDFADQVSSIGDVIGGLDKKDVVFVAAERNYRNRYIIQSLAGVPFEKVPTFVMRPNDVEALIGVFAKYGLVGDRKALNNPGEFIQQSLKQPIAVTCCRILDDFRPLDRMTKSLMDGSTPDEQLRYVVAALAQRCFAGGLRYEILVNVGGGSSYRNQLMTDHILPLTFYDRRTNSHIIPQNSIIASKILERFSEERRGSLVEIFVKLAIALAPRVNRRTIKQRTPEARLAGRLFDFDSIVDEFLGDSSVDFYNETKEAWQWNSRYWEQIALMNLSRSRRCKEDGQKSDLLELAVNNAKHAVSLERHAFPLTTLAKVLFARMNENKNSVTQNFTDAFDAAATAIKVETGRRSPHPYVTMFRGTLDFLAFDGVMSSSQIEKLRNSVKDAEKAFPRDNEVSQLSAEVKKALRTH
jgi:hypothetical protein